MRLFLTFMSGLDQYLSCGNSCWVLGLLNKIILIKLILSGIAICGILLRATSDTFQNLAVWCRKWNVYVETSQEQQAKPNTHVFCISWGLKEKLAFQNWQDESPCGQGNAAWTMRVQQLSFASLYSHLSSSKLKGSIEVLLAGYIAVCSAPILTQSCKHSGICRNIVLFVLKTLLNTHLFFLSGKDPGLVFPFVSFFFSNELRVDGIGYNWVNQSSKLHRGLD